MIKKERERKGDDLEVEGKYGGSMVAMKNNTHTNARSLKREHSVR